MADEALTLRREAWSDDAAAMLAAAADGDALALGSWARDVASGHCLLIGVYRPDAELIGRAVVEVNAYPEGREFHLMAAVGRADVALHKTVLPHFEGKARELGCDRIVMATARDGLVRVLEGRGYRRLRHVMVRDVV